MGQTERHRFIPAGSCSVAYADMPVPIGQGQTISQPFIVALMTHLAQVKFDHAVLEVGTGSGYQAAILARLVRRVCTIEIVPALGEVAAKVLGGLGYDNVSVKVGDGYYGWPECGPFDVVTAALGHVPPPLIEQLKVGGLLVMPLGLASAIQQLTVVEKIAPGQTKTRSVIPVRFVPFTRFAGLNADNRTVLVEQDCRGPTLLAESLRLRLRDECLERQHLADCVEKVESRTVASTVIDQA